MYKEARNNALEALSQAYQVDDAGLKALILEELGYIVGLQKDYSQASSYFAESEKHYETIGALHSLVIVLGYKGKILTKQNEFKKAHEVLLRSLQLKREIRDDVGIPEILDWLGELEEARGNYEKAEKYYQEALDDYRWVARLHYDCEALVGMARVKYAQGKLTEIPDLMAEAETLAQEYEYNDHLAALRLLQGHLAWEQDPASVFFFYQQALIYALRYNRFCLDEILFGDNIPTPYQPLIPFCLQRGEDGRNTLRRLKAFWQTGANDVGQPRPDTISPIPENIPLLEAERLAREREPGDGRPQMPVIERIESHLTARRSW